MSSLIDKLAPMRRSTFLKYKKKTSEEIKALKRQLRKERQYTEYMMELSCPVERREDYIAAWYMERKGRPLDLKNPKTLDEKIQWLKLYGDNEKRGEMSDKYKVREFVANTIGEEHLIPLIGAYDTVDKIDFDSLPERFVIKGNHGCGYNLIVKDKKKIDWEDAKTKIRDWMSQNFAFVNGLELQYENIERKIVVEEYLEDERGQLDDFKFYCMRDHVEAVIICMNRQVRGEKTKFYLFDENWNLLRVNRQGIEAPEGFTLMKPKNMDKMFEIARTLSVASAEPFVRVDLYNCDGDIYFGELTFTPASGADRNRSPEFDLKLGKLVELPFE